MIFTTYDPLNNPSEIFRTSDFSLRGRDVPYDLIFKELKSNLISKNEFPITTIFQTQCLTRKQGRQIRALDLTDEKDLDYLYYYWSTHLAPRRCTEDWQCEMQARNNEKYRCVRDDAEFSKDWRGAEFESALFGDEGGCECFENAKHPCTQCLHGYGPEKDTGGWEQFIRFFNLSTSLFVQPPQHCHFPYDETSTRPSKVCGGYGTPREDIYNLSISRIVLFDGDKIRRCRSLVFFERKYELRETEDDISIDWMTYHHETTNTTIRIINERLYYYEQDYIFQEELVVIDEIQRLTVLAIRFQEQVQDLKCQDLFYSDSHRVTAWTSATTSQQAIFVVPSNQDFFKGKVVMVPTFAL
jgi:hypothetical protein